MGGNVETSRSSTAPANPDVQPTVSKLMRGLQGAYDTGIKPFNQSLYPGVGPTTQNAWAQTLGAAGNQDFAGGMSGAISDFSDVAAGKRFGLNDPGYARIRQGVIDDTMSNINSQFTNSGRFGGGSHVESLGEGVGNAVAGLDYSNFQSDIARQQQAVPMAQQAFQGSLMPSAAMGTVGSAQDADALARRQAENDLFRRQNDAPWQALERSSGVLHGTAGAGGSNTSNSVPWWAAATGIGATAAGAFF